MGAVCFSVVIGALIFGELSYEVEGDGDLACEARELNAYTRGKKMGH